ncbi:hypothetical protein IV203_012876 [Nitzschia inconspicua]|uniref:Uncharacterized protein n=1 Tax=Nitzschia inconspicua TaxID=303405 RepID=A0A9K3Q7K8_9STRA|nr:hypothetical protein IV203_012876 [Nitzschia inconspicua]
MTAKMNSLTTTDDECYDYFDSTKQQHLITKEESSLAIAIRLNNRACFLLSDINNGNSNNNGNNGGGGEEQQDALDMFNSAIDRLKIHANTTKVPSDRTNADALARSFQTRTIPIGVASHNNINDNTIVDRLVLIHQHNAATMELYPIYVGCLLHNMALTYHQLAYKMTQNRVSFLTKARGLYHLVVQSLSCTGSLHRDDTTIGLCAVALNNVAELYRQEYRHDEMTHVVQQLKPMVSFLRQERSRDLLQSKKMKNNNNDPPATTAATTTTTTSVPHLVSSGDLDRITLNFVLWKVPNVAAAA